MPSKAYMPPYQLRLTPETKYLLSLISATLGLPKPDVVDFALKLLALEQNVPLPTPDQIKQWQKYQQENALPTPTGTDDGHGGYRVAPLPD